MAHVDTYMRRLTRVLGACALAVALAPSPAQACSWDCIPGYFLPRTGSTIPANAPALVWRAGQGDVVGDASTAGIYLERTDRDAGTSPVFHVVDREGESWLVLDDALVEGASYRLHQEGECAAPAVEFQVGPSAPLPDTLGVLTLSTPATRAVGVPTVSGSCTTPVAAVATTTDVELSAEAEPWAALLSYSPFVDGELFLPRASLAPESLPRTAEFALYAECPALYSPDRERDEDAAPDQGLTQAEHSVTLEARLAGVDAPLSTAARQVTLTCPSRGAVPGAGEAKESAPTDGDGSSDAAADGGKASGGCSLRPSAQGALPCVLFALLAVAWARWNFGRRLTQRAAFRAARRPAPGSPGGARTTRSGTGRADHGHGASVPTPPPPRHTA